MDMFNKSDLVTGDILIMRNGQHYVVMNGYGGDEKFNAWVGLDVKGWCDPRNFREDMVCYNNDDFDVARVMRPIHARLFGLDEELCEITYKRKPAVKMSVEDMRNKLEELTGETIEVI